jgi:hypothetical protein
MKKIFTLILLLFSFSTFAQLILTSDVNTGCPGVTVNFTITNIDPNASSVVWDYGDGTSTSNQFDPVSHTYNNEGVFIVSSSIYDEFDNLLDAATITITVDSLLIVDGGFTDPTRCEGTDGTITISGTGTGDLSWTGTNPGNIAAYNLGDQITGLTAGMYNFTFTQGACVSNNLSITLTDPAGAVISNGGFTDPTTCDGTDGTITISGTGTGDLSWTGTNGTGGTSAGTEFGVTLPHTISTFAAGTYDFIFDNGLCISNVLSFTLSDPTFPPTPTITSNGRTSICEGSTVTLTSSSNIDNVWSTGETSNEIVVSASGIYTLYVLSNGCSSSTAEQLVGVYPQINISLGETINPNNCNIAEGSIEIIGNGTGELSYFNGNITITESNITLPYTITNILAGTYDIFIDNGCVSNIINASIFDPEIPPTPSIIASGPTTFCEGDSVVLSSSSQDNNFWSTGETSETIVVSTNQTVILLINENGCSSNSVEEIVTVNSIPATPIITPSGSTTICSGNSVELSSSSSTGNLWSTGSVSQNINASSAGDYFLQVEEMGCLSNTASISINVKPSPVQPLIFVEGSTSFCEGGSVLLTSSVPTGIVWSTGQVSQSISVNSTQTVTVTASTTFCSSTSLPINVVENLNPIVNIQAYDDICNTVSPFSYTNGIPSGGFYELNGNPSTLFNPAFAILGLNTIDYTFIDANGCSGTASTPIVVYNCVELDEENTNSFVIYPNPSMGTVFVKGNENNQLQKIEVRDELGRLVFVQQDIFVETTLNLNELANGMYSLILKGSNFEKTERIQIIR